MCGLIPRVAIDAAWPDVALDRVAELLHAVRCPVLGRNQPAIPLAFTQNGRAVSVRWECGQLAARPITPDLFAIDIVMHVCRPVRLSAKWRYEWHDDSVLRRRGLPCAFPLGFARAFLASGRIECLPMLTDRRMAWWPAARLSTEWNLFADRIVEAPVSTEMATQPADAPQLTLPPLPRGHS